ncbi:Pre-mRNA-splicing factor PRP46 [Suhomyces tanzawaensis NRRL Y-17324]|uniref:Pre-mRNA-splicing factor PRP46 n=1 Tax=Suhomyces tanzawaensis NRRL Y-17324 TaxID=984487 RepID=A0A1E4SPN9_9ASCO|nr:Pre-mRNA-splicing factor PRP46 [Suhomyces tanzawaensis NRRL Y-17324]ODV81489.1 Pre-mRNA-splicing factor PRP46 [Suhomyces tanzawaensis NRRL Y-17324]
MASFKEVYGHEGIFSIGDSDPPPDTVSEAMYNNTKLDKIAGIHTNEDEFMEDDDDLQDDNDEDEDEIEDKDEDNEDKDQLAATANQPSEQWRPLRVIAGAHQGWVRAVTVDPVTNKWFVTGSSDSTIKVWDLATLALKATLTGHIMGVRALAVSSKFPYLFSGSEDKTVRCWDLEKTDSESGCQIRNYHGHVGGIYSMALHPELDLLFTGGKDSVVRVWDVRSRDQIMVLAGHRGDITSIESQIGDPQVITSSMDSTIRLWDLRKQTTALTLTHHTKSIRLLVMHPQEMTMASADSDGHIKQWLLPGGELLNEFGDADNSKIINTMAINPANNHLFAGFDDGRMEFYDYISGELIQEEISSPLAGSNESPIYASTFDLSGLRLISCEGDKSVKIWGL